MTDELRKAAERRLKPPQAFWDWCYSQITTFKWTNKQQTIVASDLKLGHCIEKRLTKSSKLTFFDKVYYFSIILVTSRRIEIQSYEFVSTVENGRQTIKKEFVNLERFENDEHVKIGRNSYNQYFPFLMLNHLGGAYTGSHLYPNDWQAKLRAVSELRYLQFDDIGFWEIERFYKYKFEIEFAQKINAWRLADEIMRPQTQWRGWRRENAVDMRTLNRKWLRKNKQFFKNSNRSFLEFELERRIKERNGKLIPGIEKHLSFKDIKKIPQAIGINKFQNWVIRHNINFIDYLDYLKMLADMGIEPEGDGMIVPKDFEAMHAHTVDLYNQFREEQRRLANEERARKQRELDKRLEAEFKALPNLDKVISGYSFHVPTRVAELIYEGKKLHHCVSSYTKKHFKGESTIVFVRLENKPNTPLYTLEVRAGQIVQMRGKYNKEAPDEVFAITKEWMKAVKLNKKAS